MTATVNQPDSAYSFCTQCGAEWKSGRFNGECGQCAAVLAQLAPPEPMPPHRYPPWLIACAAAVLLAAIYSLAIVPGYFRAARLLRRSQHEIADGRLDAAKEHLEGVLKVVPTSKTARIELAIVTFRNPSPSEHLKALGYLEGLEIDKSDMERLRKAMPDEYQRFFTTKKKKD
jgi:hypothetical protein